MRWIGIAWIAVVVAGCTAPGRIVYYTPDGSQITVDQPGKAETPATLSLSESGVLISTGNTFAPTPLSENSHLIYLAGIGLMVCGGASLILRKWFPIFPMSGSVTLLALGAALLFLPTIILKAWWLLPAAGAVYLIGMYANKRKERQT